jgi:hypothetical protein
MAKNFYALAASAQKRMSVAIHISIPAGNNKVGVPYADALLLSGISRGRSVLPSGDGTVATIDPAERIALANGSRFEFVQEITLADDFDSMSVANRNAVLDAFASSAITDQVQRLRDQLDYFGATR